MCTCCSQKSGNWRHCSAEFPLGARLREQCCILAVTDEPVVPVDNRFARMNINYVQQDVGDRSPFFRSLRLWRSSTAMRCAWHDLRDNGDDISLMACTNSTSDHTRWSSGRILSLESIRAAPSTGFTSVFSARSRKRGCCSRGLNVGQVSSGRESNDFLDVYGTQLSSTFMASWIGMVAERRHSWQQAVRSWRESNGDRTVAQTAGRNARRVKAESHFWMVTRCLTCRRYALCCKAARPPLSSSNHIPRTPQL